MSFVVNIRYVGTGGAAKKFMEEMFASGTVEKIRAESGNLRYEYFLSASDPETVLLVDEWVSEEALDEHHKSPMMQVISDLRKKYNLKMKVERFVRTK